jgi:calpain-5
LIKSHAYGITAVRKVPVGNSSRLMSLFRGKRERMYLVRLQNPWGEKEWTGPFSDRSPEWDNISKRERSKLGLTVNDDDGEFWMTFDDFLRQFSEMSICRLINTSVFTRAKTWREVQLFGSWKGKDRAGGCINHPDTVLNNPQYRLDIVKDEDEVIMMLSQRDSRSATESKELLVIGLHIMHVENNRKYRMHKLQRPMDTPDYVKTKHFFLKTKLPRGRYVVVPTTFNPGQNGDYLLRVFTGGDVDVKELVKDEPEASAWWQCHAAEPSVLTRVKVKEAAGLENQNTFFSKSDPYCLIKCEGKTVKSEVVRDNLNPKWSTASAVFYRRDPSKPVLVQIWNNNLIMDSFMGQAVLEAPPAPGPTRHLQQLLGKNKVASKKLGSVTVEVESYQDMTAL